MNILAIETSGATCGVAVFSLEAGAGKMLSVVESCVGNVHDELLATTIDSALLMARLQLSAVNVVALSAGPGSFTGLRIGAAMAKGLCFGSDRYFLDVGTCDALASAAAPVAAVGSVERIVTVIPSHRQLSYLAIYSKDASNIAPVALVTEDAVRSTLTTTDLVVGPSTEMYSSIARTVSGLNRLSARFVGFAACNMLSKGASFSDVVLFEPSYHQRFPDPR